jgi:phage gpG-like protein
MIEVTIDDRPAQKILRDMQGRFTRVMPDNVRPISRLIGEAIEQQFATEGEYEGRKWERLADSTAKRKGSGGRMLIDTGNMFESFTVAGHQNQQIKIEGGNRLIFEVSGTPAEYHQEGRGVPERHVVPDPMPEAFMRKLQKLVTGYVIGTRF